MRNKYFVNQDKYDIFKLREDFTNNLSKSPLILMDHNSVVNADEYYNKNDDEHVNLITPSSISEYVMICSDEFCCMIKEPTTDIDGSTIDCEFVNTISEFGYSFYINCSISFKNIFETINPILLSDEIDEHIKIAYLKLTSLKEKITFINEHVKNTFDLKTTNRLKSTVFKNFSLYVYSNLGCGYVNCVTKNFKIETTIKMNNHDDKKEDQLVEYVEILFNYIFTNYKILSYIDQPRKYVISEGPIKKREYKNINKKIPIDERDHYYVISPDEVKNIYRTNRVDHGGTHASPMPHMRCGYMREFKSDVYKNMKGSKMWIRPTYVGDREWFTDNKKIIKIVSRSGAEENQA
jgi:hypothetical protein